MVLLPLVSKFLAVTGFGLSLVAAAVLIRRSVTRRGRRPGPIPLPVSGRRTAPDDEGMLCDPTGTDDV
jgi:hypothetical protein